MTHAAQFALTHGAALLFAWILLQQAGVPIPSAPLLIAVGSLASNGRLRLVPSLVAAFTACLLADGFWYRVGRRGWSKSHRFCLPKSTCKNRVLSLIWRHSGAAILFAKFVVGSNVVSLLAGQAGLSAARFLIYDCIGSLTWSGSYIALGYLVHGQLHWTLAQTLRPLLVVRAAIFLARLWRRRSLPHAAMLALATAFLCPVRPVSQHSGGWECQSPFCTTADAYNHDGYGQREDGSSYLGWGKGRPWPLLTGERGHYEIAAGRDAAPYLRALEDFSQGIGRMPEQIWDGPELPNYYLRFGGTTDAAMPLLWAHSEYVKLHRSAADGQVFDLVEAAFERYVKGSGERKNHGSLEAESSGPNGTGLHAPADTSELSVSILHWTSDDWQHSKDVRSQGTAIGIEFVDIPLPKKQNNPIQFTFLWLDEDRWEGQGLRRERARTRGGGTRRWEFSATKEIKSPRGNTGIDVRASEDP